MQEKTRLVFYVLATQLHIYLHSYKVCKPSFVKSYVINKNVLIQKII